MRIVVFRVDASIEIGTGHVMRCLTLAESLRKEGSEVFFISRDLPGNMIEHVEAKGIPVKRLPAPDDVAPAGPPAHAAWGGVPWQRDAKETVAAMEASDPDWLVVDHYAFDDRWEKATRSDQMKILAIDDLADRPHVCELLLDQNLGREVTDYEGLVPDYCKLLIGPRYALLRPEFAARRSEGLNRRQHGKLERILVSMGGIDPGDATSEVLEALTDGNLDAHVQICVIMGSKAPALERVKARAERMPWPTEVIVDTPDMAARMVAADLAIGAAGSTTWERCCLGLPTGSVQIAENQSGISLAVEKAGAAVNLGPINGSDFAAKLQSVISQAREGVSSTEMAEAAAHICDGDGSARVTNELVKSGISFRDADLRDTRRIWEWRQYPGRERFNKGDAEPAFRDHHDWFANALAGQDRTFRIIQLGQLPCGYLRIDRLSNKRGKISICLSEDARGKNLSRGLLSEADRVAVEMGLSEIDAEIHEENTSSKRAFESADYSQVADSPPFLLYKRNLEMSA